MSAAKALSPAFTSVTAGSMLAELSTIQMMSTGSSSVFAAAVAVAQAESAKIAEVSVGEASSSNASPDGPSEAASPSVTSAAASSAASLVSGALPPTVVVPGGAPHREHAEEQRAPERHRFSLARFACASAVRASRSVSHVPGSVQSPGSSRISSRWLSARYLDPVGGCWACRAVGSPTLTDRELCMPGTSA